MNSRIKEDVHRLFEFWCEIAPPKNEENSSSGQIIESFPESFRDQDIIKKLPDFAYPYGLMSDTNVQTYSFVLTSDDSKWRFGFCRHDYKTRTAMVLISYLPWHDTFIKFLNILGQIKIAASDEFHPFLMEAYKKGVPEPGGSLKLFYNAGQNNFMFQRPSQFQLPSIPENHNLNLYYNFIDAKNMIGVFAAMLAERRIIFTSNRLDKISSCIQAANTFLYPMVWQHIFIPILPMKMKDILCAPMPFLIGVPVPVLETMTKDELGDVVILNCDKNSLETPFDDVKAMPQELIDQLKKQLKNNQDHIGDRISKIFLGILVQLIGGYRDAVKFAQGPKITWDRETFIKSRPDHLRPFLNNMMELQIFQQFIDERLDMLNTGLGFSDEFELETLRFHEKSGKRGKHYKEFFKSVKQKTNPAVKSAVKSVSGGASSLVKEGSRGVKSAYKDLKSKIRDRTPPSQGTFESHMGNTVQFGQTGSSTIGSCMGNNSNGHHSAPNSPVFKKRPLSEIPSIIRNPNMLTVASNSLTSNNANLEYNNQINNINTGIGLSSDPTLSQTSISSSSSNSSSEMNLLEELEQHALFKKAVDPRSESMDTINNRDVPTGILLSLDNDTTPDNPDHLGISSFYSSSKSNSSYDTPPDIPSPPVPNCSRSASAALVTDLCTPNSSSFISCESISLHKDLFCLTSDSQNLKNTHSQAPNNKAKKEPDVVEDDLINLDGNSSFEIEDFDPLNQNAKPLPKISIHPTVTPRKSYSTAGAYAAANPTYPYFTPQHQKKINSSITNGSDDELELLRKYGLDQFNLSENRNQTKGSVLNTSQGRNQSNGIIKDQRINGNRGWTTFD